MNLFAKHGRALLLSAALAAVAVVCTSNGGRPPELVGRWEDMGNGVKIDLFKDGTGVAGDEEITWKTKGKRFLLSGASKKTSAVYSLSDYEFTQTFDNGDVVVWVRKGSAEEYNKKKAVETKTTYETDDAFTDGRDGKTYRKVTIGRSSYSLGSTWMAENLNYKTGNSWCYGDDDSNCEKYGRLYDWETAMTACPQGWRLPNRWDWRSLVIDNSRSDEVNYVGSRLKAKTDWIDNGSGADYYGFTALPGGARAVNGTFNNLGNRGLWWVGTEYDSDSAYYRRMGYNYGYVYEGNYGKGNGFSVRCVRGCRGRDYDSERQFCGGDTIYDKCGGKEYDPKTQICNKSGKIKGLCDDKEYDPGKQFCHKYISPSSEDEMPRLEEIVKSVSTIDIYFSSELIDKCGGKEYDPIWQECNNGEIRNAECDGKKYNRKGEFCHEGKIVKNCGVVPYYYYHNGKINKIDYSGGESYNPETQFCATYCGGCCNELSYRVTEKCGGKEFDIDMEFCHNNEIIKICNPDANGACDSDGSGDRYGSYDPDTEFCYNNTKILAKCGNAPYNPDKQKCQNGSIVNK